MKVIRGLFIQKGRRRASPLAQSRMPRLEAEADEFRARLRAGFLAIAEAESARFLVVDAALPRETITALVVEEVHHRLALRIGAP